VQVVQKITRAALAAIPQYQAYLLQPHLVAEVVEAGTIRMADMMAVLLMVVQVAAHLGIGTLPEREV
jgi:hypothetical protein